jgi:hypothetical protein
LTASIDHLEAYIPLLNYSSRLYAPQMTASLNTTPR